MGRQGVVDPTASVDWAPFGELLASSRAAVGLGLDELAEQSGLDPDRVAAVEQGRHDLTDVELAELLDRYRLPSMVGRFQHLVVEIDLEGSSLRLRKVRRRRSTPAADRNLLRYLCLLHERHDLDPGADVPLRAVDLVLLRSALALRRDEVESRLARLTGRVRPALASDRSLWAAAVGTGMAVAAGAVILIPSASIRADTGPVVDSGLAQPATQAAEAVEAARADAAPAIDPRIQLGEPVRIERSPDEIPEESLRPADGEAAETSTPAVAPGIEIGEPLVIERSPSELPPDGPERFDSQQRGPPDATGAFPS